MIPQPFQVINFYTDGAYSSKTEMGGWAAIGLNDEGIFYEEKGYEPYTTNNRMELTAVLAVLEYVNSIYKTTPDLIVNIHTDSAYIANAFNDKWYLRWMKNGWKTADKKDVKNQDLWSRMISLYIRLIDAIQIRVVKVESHANNEYNNYVDKLAVAQRKLLEV